MKKIISITTVILIVFSSILLNGCSNDKKTPKKSAVKKTVVSGSNTSAKLKEYLSKFTDGKDLLYGSWRVKGSNLFTFIFRNDGYAQVAIGGEANFTKLTVNKNKKTLSLSLPGTLDGTFNYSFSNNNKNLTLKTSGASYEMKKQNGFSIVPNPPKNPKIDKNLIGWWKDSGDIIYFFSTDGVMYSNSIAMETAYTYNAGNGKINAIYEYSGKNKVDFKYKFKNKKLYIDGEKFKKFNP